MIIKHETTPVYEDKFAKVHANHRLKSQCVHQIQYDRNNEKRCFSAISIFGLKVYIYVFNFYGIEFYV